MAKKSYTSTGKLFRLIIRRDRIRIPIWLIFLTSLSVVIAYAYTNLFTTEQEIQIFAETMRNPGMTAMMGPGYGLDNYTYGAMMAHTMLIFTAIAVAIMSIFLVVRHTRADEERGRIELIRSLPVGRLSSLSSAVLVSFSVNVILALLTGIGMSLLGIDSIDLQGSLLYGAALGGVGIFFTSITAFFAQLTENSRSTIGISFGFLGLAYIIRAVGDVSSEVLSWISPLGWITHTQVYVNNYWWPLLIVLGASSIFTAAAIYLNSIRDLEAGLLPTKPGQKTASIFLKNPLSLSLKLQRTSIISWMIGMFILGVSYGSVAGDVELFLDSVDMYRELFIISEDLPLIEQFITTLMSVISIICTVPALIMFFKLKKEENENRTEPVYARAVSRNSMMGAHLSISIIGGFIMLFLSAFGLWAAAASVMDDPLTLSTVLKSALIYLPAMWVMVGTAVFFTGYKPGITIFSWLYLGYSFLVIYLGELLQFPDWMDNISPFGYIPNYPVENITLGSPIILTVTAAILIILGFRGYNQRDIMG